MLVHQLRLQAVAHSLLRLETEMTKAKFSPTHRGIYPTSVYKTFPEDSLDIPDALYAEYISGQISGFGVLNGTVVSLDVLPKPIERLRSEKSKNIDQACRNAIYAGFISNALGAAYHYPAKDKDQANLVGSVTESLYPNLPPEWVTPFWCATESENGEWAYRLHTAAQIQQVGADAKAAIVAALTYNAQLQAQIAVADAEGLEAIEWNPPA